MTLLEVLSDHTYRTVLLGTTLIGLVAGALGALAYVRKQSLVSDVIAHAALPGTLVGFLVTVLVLGGDGRAMPMLLVGAVVVGTLAVQASELLARHTVLAIDTAMAISLVVFFGAGMLALRVLSRSGLPGAGGVQDYLFGNASVLTRADLVTAAVVGAVALGLLVLFWKEFALRVFDPAHATVLGFSGRVVDTLMMSAITIATVIGVKAVGLVLMVAFIITPPAAARQWVRTWPAMVVLSATIGAAGSSLGAYASIVIGAAPTGPVVVLTLFAVLVVSVLVAPGRSVLARAIRRRAGRRNLIRELAAESARSASIR